MIDASTIVEKYAEHVDRESAYEILTQKMYEAGEEEHRKKMKGQWKKGKRKEESVFEDLWNSTTTRQIGRTVARELTRGLLGVMGVKTTRRRRKRKNTWF